MDENKNLQEVSEEIKTEESVLEEGVLEEGVIGKNLPEGTKNVLEILMGLAIWAAFIFIIIGAFSSDCLQCTWCGDANNRLFVFAKGTSEEGIEYVSCVGPAGCVGCGINSKCWPTECLYVKGASENGGVTTGCITYYNEAGCITKSDVKSKGTYSENTTGCFGISCSGENYVEVVADSQYATEQNTCLGAGCGSKLGTEVRGYNNVLPRQFKKGCWGVEKKEEEDKQEKGGK